MPYEIKNNKIYADVLHLTKAEKAEVKTYQEFGLELVIVKAEEKEVVNRLDEKYILDYLSKDKDAIKAYKDAKNAPVLNEAGQKQYHIKKNGERGKLKTAGFNAGRDWFAKNYPADAKEAYSAIKEANKEKAFNKRFKAYEANEDIPADRKMTKDQYARNYYWKNIFVKPEEAEEE